MQVVDERCCRAVEPGGQQFCGVPAERMLRQQSAVKRRIGRREPRLAQPLARGRDFFVDGAQETAVASFSFSDW